MILIIKFIMFANTAVLCLITTRYLQHVYLMAYKYYVEEIPKELSQLNALGRELVQRVKVAVKQLRAP